MPKKKAQKNNFTMAKKKRKKNNSKIKTPAAAEEATVQATDAILSEAQAKHEVTSLFISAY